MTDEHSDDIDNEPDDTEAEEAEGQDESGSDDEWTPPSKTEWNKLQRQLKRAVSESKTAKAKAAEAPAPDDVETAKQAVRAEAELAAKARIVRSEAKAKLAAAGAQGDLSRLIKLIDVDDIELSDDDELDGLDEQIDELKTDYPQLFSAEKSRRDPRAAKDAADKAPAKSKQSSAELLTAQLRG